MSSKNFKNPFSFPHLKERGFQKEKIYEKHNINWNDYPVELKRGSACIRTEEGWIIDHEMPILKGDNRNYVDKLIYIEED